MDDAFNGVSELCHNPPERPFAFAVSELSFDGDAVEFVLAFESLLLLECFRILGGRFFQEALIFRKTEFVCCNLAVPEHIPALAEHSNVQYSGVFRAAEP